MTKGKALLEARRLFGPLGHVRTEPTDENCCKVGVLDNIGGWTETGAGPTWATALDDAATNKAVAAVVNGVPIAEAATA